MPSPAAAEPSTPTPKRRKLRKGTMSCWECKRRKTRCTFTRPAEATCDGCRSRRTKCISQDFADEATATGRKADRLGRMETLVEQLAHRNGVSLSKERLESSVHYGESEDRTVSIATIVFVIRALTIKGTKVRS